MSKKSELEELFEDDWEETLRDVKLIEIMEKYYKKNILPTLRKDDDTYYDIPVDSGFTKEIMVVYLKMIECMPNDVSVAGPHLKISRC